MSKRVISIICLSFTLQIFAGFDDFCDYIYEHYIINSGTPQDKYLSQKLNDIIKGDNTKKQEALKSLLNVVTKKRVGKCSVRFLESLSTYINDYIGTVRSNEDIDVVSAKIKESIGDKIECLTIRNDLNLRLKIKLPSVVCDIPKCYVTLLQLESALGEKKNLILITFLELFWRSYYTKNVTIKNDTKKEWEKVICSGITEDIAEKMIKNEEVSDPNALIDNEDFKRNVAEFVIKYLGHQLIPKCGKQCAYKVIEIASDRTLQCDLRTQLLELVSLAFRGTYRSIDFQSELKLFHAFERLVKDECFAIQAALSNVLFDLSLFTNEKIMDVVVNKILSSIKNNSLGAKFLKESIVDGFVNVSHIIHSIKKLPELLEFFRNEFEKSNDYEYKEKLLRALFAFNQYKYILKNKNKLYDDFRLRSKQLNVKGIPKIYVDSSGYVSSLLQIGALYGLSNFKDFFDKEVKNSVQELVSGGISEKDKEYLFLLFTLFGYTDRKFQDGYLMEILKGVSMVAPFMIKQFGLKALFYNALKKDLINNYISKLFEYPDTSCLSYLINALLGDKTVLGKVDNIEHCEKIKLNTNAVKELIKISLEPRWKDKIKDNPDAGNILNLAFSKAKKIVEYRTCGIGHGVLGTFPTFLKNVLYGLECSEYERKSGASADVTGLSSQQGTAMCASCDKMSFVSSIVYLLVNAMENPHLYKRLDDHTNSTTYKGPLKFILRKIAKELNATVSFKALEKGFYRYLVNFYSGFIVPTDTKTGIPLYSYKTLLTKISERFLITFIFTKSKRGVNIIKVVPFESAAILWQLKLKEYLKD